MYLHCFPENCEILQIYIHIHIQSKNEPQHEQNQICLCFMENLDFQIEKRFTEKQANKFY
jgi:hypothetical protein